METFLVVLVGGLMLYVGYLHLQLYISRRIISALQETTVTAEAGARLGLRPALALLGVLILAVGALANLAR